MCLWTAGFRMPGLAARTGLALSADDRVLVDAGLRSISHRHVHVAGDMASPVRAPGDPLPMGCKSAGPAGVHVAENLARELQGRAPVAFDFATPFYCVSLGRRQGLVQWPRDGATRGPVTTGRIGALVKEVVSRSTWWALCLESFGLPVTLRRGTGRAPAIDAVA
jgi:NADH dehydrogenase FAD-containing subunit